MAPKLFMDSAACSDATAGSRRALKRQDTGKKASKCITDNYKGELWDSERTHVKKVDGKTLFETICGDIHACRANGVEFYAGKKYNDDKKLLFGADGDGVLARLDSLIDENLDISPTIIKAMTAAQRKQSDRSLMHSFVRCGHAPNITEAVGIVSWAIQINHSNLKNMGMILDTMRYIARHNLKTTMPVFFDTIKAWYSDMLVATYTKNKSMKARPSIFLDTFSTLWPLIMDTKSLDVLKSMDETKLVASTSTLLEVVGSSSLGEAVFGPCIKMVASNILEHDIEDKLSGRQRRFHGNYGRHDRYVDCNPDRLR